MGCPMRAASAAGNWEMQRSGVSTPPAAASRCRRPSHSPGGPVISATGAGYAHARGSLMTMTRLEAYATTSNVDPGTESQDAAGVHIRRRVCTDRVEAQDPRLDGTNTVTLDLDINPADGTGVLAGAFELT